METYDSSLPAFDRSGYLSVRVFTAGGAIPVEGALVTVNGVDDVNTFSSVLSTGEDGTTPKIALPSPPSIASLTPPEGEGVRPYALYGVTVEKDGFYVKTIERVPVFEAIHSIQPVELIPKTPYEEKRNDPKIDVGEEAE